MATLDIKKAITEIFSQPSFGTKFRIHETIRGFFLIQFTFDTPSKLVMLKHYSSIKKCSLTIAVLPRTIYCGSFPTCHMSHSQLNHYDYQKGERE